MFKNPQKSTDFKTDYINKMVLQKKMSHLLNSKLKDNWSNSVSLSPCAEANQQCIGPAMKYCVCIQSLIHLLPLCHRSPMLSKNTNKNT